MRKITSPTIVTMHMELAMAKGFFIFASFFDGFLWRNPSFFMSHDKSFTSLYAYILASVWGYLYQDPFWLVLLYPFLANIAASDVSIIEHISSFY